MKLRLLALALVVCGGAAAQNPYIALQGADETSGGIVVSQPRTVLAVDVTAERDVTLSGPYARYAQKFLGVRAPLTDKMSWAVTGASVALLDPKACLDAPAPAQPSRTVMAHATSEDEFSRLQADKNDMAVLALEDAAREAANTIFSLRRHRIELITGEAGENVFGEGLKAALAEIERLRQYGYRRRGFGQGVQYRDLSRGRPVGLHGHRRRPRVCPRGASAVRVRPHDQRRASPPQIAFTDGLHVAYGGAAQGVAPRA